MRLGEKACRLCVERAWLAIAATMHAAAAVCRRYIFKQGHAAAWLHLYTNGKSAVRPDAPGVTQGGPHVFVGPADAR